MSQDQGQSASRKKHSTGREWSAHDTETIKRMVKEHPHEGWEKLRELYEEGKYKLSQSYSSTVVQKEVKARWEKIAERTEFTPEQWMILCRERDSKDQARRSYSRIWLDYFPEYTKKTLELKYRKLSDEDIKYYLNESAASRAEIVRTEPPGGYALNMNPENNAKYVYATWLEGKEKQLMNDDQYLHKYFLKYGFKNLTINAISQFVRKMKKNHKPVPSSIPAVPTMKGIWWNKENLSYLRRIAEEELQSVFHGDWKSVLNYRFEGLGLNHTMLSQKYNALRSGKAAVEIDVRINSANLNREKQNKVFKRAHGLKKIVWDSANDDFALAYYLYRNGEECRSAIRADEEVFLKRHNFTDSRTKLYEELFLKRHDFTDTLKDVYNRGSELNKIGSKPGGEKIDLRAGPPGEYLMDLEDWEFHEWLCDTSDQNPGEITDLMKYYMPRCVNEPAEIYNLRRHFWDTTGHEDIECPLKFPRKSTPKTSTSTTRTRSSKAKLPSSREPSQSTNIRDNRDLYEVTPPLPLKSSHSKQREEGYASGGWRSVNKPAPEQRNRSPSKFRETKSKETASLAFRPSPPRASDSTASNLAMKRPAISTEREDNSKRTRDGTDPLRR
ncbi:hypothetical protein BOTNAR_0909g00020 [Botryotinia narcissicola]|uniref:Uncharacterized protein n=1 Tax=Botryotinia narcissicola TaxID=278944 RepID=A0A4Z1HGJ4_9HELO|nr:hypothetical protein BOTNAR_0909g00020 [Botryotinia narcissicola]